MARNFDEFFDEFNGYLLDVEAHTLELYAHDVLTDDQREQLTETVARIYGHMSKKLDKESTAMTLRDSVVKLEDGGG